MSAGAEPGPGDPRFRELFEWASIGIVMADTAGRLVAVNPAFCRMVGYSGDDLVGMHFVEPTHPDDRAASWSLFERVLAGEIATGRMEKRYLRSDGETIWVDITISFSRDDEGRPLHSMATLADITDRKAAEREIERFRSLQQVVGRLARVGGWVLDLPSMQLVAFEQLRDLLDLPGAAIPLEQALDLIREPFREAVASALRACASEGSVQELEFPLDRRDGGEMWLRVVAEAERDAHGAVVRIIGATQDVTDLRKANEEVREVAERLTSTLESISDGFFTVDRDWRITYVNRRSEETLGRSRSTLLGRNLLEEFPENLITETGAAYQRAMTEGRPEVLEDVYFPSMDAWFSVRAFPSASGLAVFYQDVTERRRTLDLLKENAARLAEQAALLDEARDAIIVRDLDHRITYWNRSAERTYGWTAEEARGRSLRELLFVDPAPFDEAAAKLSAEGEWHGDLTVTTRDGHQLIVECREKLLRDDAGRPTSVLAIKTDITERRRLEAQYWRAQRMESIGTLADGLAHNLNNALMPVVMATDLLRRDESDQARLAMLDTIAAGTERATEIVRHIRSFVGDVEGRRLPVDVGALLRDVERMAVDSFYGTVRVIRHEAADLPPVTGDPTQLNQVLVNLCVNARDAMPDGGTLVLAADLHVVGERSGDVSDELPPGRYVRIRVEDDGFGMAPEVVERIFEPFYTTKENATGLGLSTSAGIVRSHAGFMSVQSEPHGGTTVVVHLPAAAGAAPAVPPSESPPSEGKVILVVDDEDHVRRMLRLALQAFGYRVLEASDGAGAVALFNQSGGEIDLVLTDMMMPGMNGLETIRAVRDIRPDVPVVLASGLDTSRMTEEAAALGVGHVLSKPFTVPTLLHALSEVLDGGR